MFAAGENPGTYYPFAEKTGKTIVDSIRKLLPQDGREIYDPEKMTIEILVYRLQDLIDGNFLNVSTLPSMRAMALEVAGQPKEDTSGCKPVPEALHRLHCVDYDKLSAVNRRECFRLVLNYLGLTKANGGELLGHDHWHRLMRSIEVKCGGMQTPSAIDGSAALTSATSSADAPATSFAASPGSAEHTVEDVATIELDDWTRRALTARLSKLLDTDSFSMYSLDMLDSALQKARKYLLLPQHDASNTSQYVGLGLLGMSRYADIDQATCAGLPATILEALALDDTMAPRLLGATGWQQVKIRYAAGIAESGTKRGDDESNTLRLPTPKRLTRAVIVSSMLGALTASIAIFVGMSRETRVVATLASPIRTAPTTLKPRDVPSEVIRALPGNPQEAATDTLQPFVPPLGSDSDDLQPLP